MIIQLPETEGQVVIIKEDSDPKVYNESLLYHKIKKKLIEMGYDVIKKRMWKDGHMVSDNQHYIRSRKFKEGCWCVWDTHWQIRQLQTDYNKGRVTMEKVILI